MLLGSFIVFCAWLLGGIFMNRLILLFFAKAILCFHLSLFIRTIEFSLSASVMVILYFFVCICYRYIIWNECCFRNFRLSPLCRWDLRYCGLLRSVGWLLPADRNVILIWPVTRLVNLHLCNILGRAGALIGFLTSLFFYITWLSKAIFSLSVFCVVIMLSELAVFRRVCKIENRVF
jgi:hypothetical protein